MELEEKTIDTSKSEDTWKKYVGTSCLVFGVVLLLLGIISIIVKTYSILQEGVFGIDILLQYIPGLILFGVGYVFFIFGKHIRDLLSFFAKLCITGSAFFLSGAIILFSFHSQAALISENVQPTLDTIIIDYIYSQEGDEIEILQDLLNTTTTFETFSVASLTQRQNEFIQKSFNIKQIEDLSELEKEELPSKIISSIYSALKSQNQRQLLNSPLPIKQIIFFLDSVGDLELTLLSMSYLSDVKPEATLIIMVPSEIQLNSPQENLEYLRDECDSLDENQICSAFELSEYENLLEFIATNESLPIDLNVSNLESINTIDKLQENIKDKTSYYSLFFLLSLACLLLGYLLFEKKNKTIYENSTIQSSQEITLQILKYFVFPTLVITILFILIQTGYLMELFQSSLLLLTQGEFPIQLETLPIFENVILFISQLFYYHVSILLFLSLVYFALRRQKKNLITKELV